MPYSVAPLPQDKQNSRLPGVQPSPTIGNYHYSVSICVHPPQHATTLNMRWAIRLPHATANMLRMPYADSSILGRRLKATTPPSSLLTTSIEISASSRRNQSDMNQHSPLKCPIGLKPARARLPAWITVRVHEALFSGLIDARLCSCTDSKRLGSSGITRQAASTAMVATTSWASPYCPALICTHPRSPQRQRPHRN